MDCGYVCAGLVNMAMGRPEAAVPLFEYALRLNPRFRPFTKQKFLGVAHIQSGQDEAAIHALNRALAGAPRDLFANLALTSALALADRSKEASKALARSLDLAPGDATTLAALRDNYGWLGPDFERVLEGLQMAGLTG
jgi:tetratricopeptide (TPR) repeat protein